jgi:aminoacrylate hydrolase
MAFEHSKVTRSIVLASSLARADGYYRRQFDMRRTMLRDSGVAASAAANALFMFSPLFARHTRMSSSVGLKQQAAPGTVSIC